MATDFNFEERNLIGVGLRNYVGVLQTTVKVVSAIGASNKYLKYGDNLPKFKIGLQLKLRTHCLKCIDLLRKAYKLCATPESMGYF